MNNFSSEQYQAMMFAYEQIGSLKYMYSLHIPAVYSILIRNGFNDNEDTIEGLRKAIALKFFGDVHAGRDSEEIGSYLKSFSFKRVDRKGGADFEYHWADGLNIKNEILKCYLYYNQSNVLFE